MESDEQRVARHQRELSKLERDLDGFREVAWMIRDETPREIVADAGDLGDLVGVAVANDRPNVATKIAEAVAVLESCVEGEWIHRVNTRTLVQRAIRHPRADAAAEALRRGYGEEGAHDGPRLVAEYAREGRRLIDEGRADTPAFRLVARELRALYYEDCWYGTPLQDLVGIAGRDWLEREYRDDLALRAGIAHDQPGRLADIAEELGRTAVELAGAGFEDLAAEYAECAAMLRAGADRAPVGALTKPARRA